MITKKEWKLVDCAMQDVLDKLRIEAPNSGNILTFNIDGVWEITDSYGEVIKTYKVFENAIDYLLLND